MKPVLDNIETRLAELSSGRAQLPSAFDGFRKAEVSGLLSDVNPPRRRILEQQSNSLVTRPQTSFSNHVTRGLILTEVIDSPVTMTGESLAQFPPVSDLISNDIGKDSAPSRPTLSRTQSQWSSSRSRTNTISSTAARSFHYFLPILLAISALIFDIPLVLELQKYPGRLTLPGDSSLMLSLTVCSMLLLWLCGCVVLVILAFIVLEVVSCIDGDKSSSKLFRIIKNWKWL